MRQTCPKCEEVELAQVSKGVSKCATCGGSFVARGAAAELADASADAQAASTDATGGRCPADRTIMTRTEIYMGLDRPPLHLERCSSCLAVWFDAGEWTALAERELIHHLDELWSVEWRSQQRKAQEQESYEQRLREAFGPVLFQTLRSVAGALRGHERRSQALAFLREASDE